MKFYQVTLFRQFPAWDETDGVAKYYIDAPTKSEALKDAKRKAYRAGHIGGGGAGKGQGRAIWKTEEI